MDHATTRDSYESELGGGLLKAHVYRADIPLDQLCDFALRNNPNRKVLVVSRVAGRHIPVKPSVAQLAFAKLAARIPTDLPGPVVVIGLAESAIGLGHGVYDAYRSATRRDDTLFIHSSRHRLGCEVAVYFEEEHSHATQEYLYAPHSARHRQLFRRCRSVVIVDDELTTGRTICNLGHTLMRSMPEVQQIVVANLTDWRIPKHVEKFAANMPVASQVVSVLEGHLSFTGGPTVVKMPALVGNRQLKDTYVSERFGRRGLQELHLPTPAIDTALAHARGRVLVLATEEFAYPPFMLAAHLEMAGHNVVYQSTTRTPAIVGTGAMKVAMRFTDNYGDNIDNFAYNVEPGMYDSVLICHETPQEALDPVLSGSLNATTVRFL